MSLTRVFTSENNLLLHVDATRHKKQYCATRTASDNACEWHARHPQNNTHAPCATRTSQRDYARKQHDDAQTMSCANNEQINN